MMNNRNAKRLLVVGSLPWFADSFRIFSELGFESAFVRTDAPLHPWFAPTFDLLKSIGFKEIGNTDREILEYLGAADCSIIISGGEFFPPGAYLEGGDSVKKLELFRDITSLARKHKLTAFCVRFNNGETYFTNHATCRFYASCLKDLDLLLFDTQPLVDYVLYNCPELASLPRAVALMESPLERFFTSAVDRPISQRLLLLGRMIAGEQALSPFGRGFRYRIKEFLKSRLPLNVVSLVAKRSAIGRDPGGQPVFSLFYPVLTPTHPAGLAPDLDRVDRARRTLVAECGNCIGGISHFYDFPWNAGPASTLEEKFGFGAQTTIRANHQRYGWPALMRRTNVASKITMYLMMGIPPVVPDDPDQPVTALLKPLNMCFAVGVEDKAWQNELVSEATIRAKRLAVFQNAKMFAFERVIEALDQAIEKSWGYRLFRK